MSRDADHYVYGLYDEGDELLYVGCTADPDRRMRGHASSKWWWPLVARVEVDGPYLRLDGLRREHELIGSSRPTYNHQHNPTPPGPDNPLHVAAAKRLAEALGISYRCAFLYIASGHLPARDLNEREWAEFIKGCPSTRRGADIRDGMLARMVAAKASWPTERSA